MQTDVACVFATASYFSRAASATAGTQCGTGLVCNGAERCSGYLMPAAMRTRLSVTSSALAPEPQDLLWRPIRSRGGRAPVLVDEVVAHARSDRLNRSSNVVLGRTGKRARTDVSKVMSVLFMTPAAFSCRANIPPTVLPTPDIPPT